MSAQPIKKPAQRESQKFYFFPRLFLRPSTLHYPLPRENVRRDKPLTTDRSPVYPVKQKKATTKNIQLRWSWVAGRGRQIHGSVDSARGGGANAADPAWLRRLHFRFPTTHMSGGAVSESGLASVVERISCLRTDRNGDKRQPSEASCRASSGPVFAVRLNEDAPQLLAKTPPNSTCLLRTWVALSSSRSVRAQGHHEGTH